MRAYPTTTNERAESYFTHCFEITADDLSTTTANTAQTFTTNVVCAPGDFVTSAGHYLKTAFQATGDAAFNTDTMSIGDSVGGVATIYAAVELNANGTTINAKHAACTGTPLSGFTAATTITITFNAMAAKNLNALNAGSVVVFIRMFRPSKLANALSSGPLLVKS